MNARFREYATETAFNLTLKKSHISALHAIAADSHELAFRMSIFVPAVKALERRGLVEFTNSDGTKNSLGECYRITEAGRLAYALVIEAGLISTSAGAQAA